MNAEPDKILWALRHYNLAEMLEHPRKFPAGFEADAADLIESLQAENAALKEANKWIPVSERLPEQPPDFIGNDGMLRFVSGGDYLVADTENNVYEAHYTFGCSSMNYFWYHNSLTPLQNVTHWRPMPEPPQKG